ncbi:hypothetical protein ATO6_09930 [Oceanicola sp. 22II-s10i]|uniref:hypothetical protein n=1 Tax=Oceanicola sp. 22II-s10i TaxID=1317116 RepID=UPI000B520C40|nr:hypothetical protein [Oceanicola sp. 22II-s10i]OWU85325.1 hypothetical protein ATO6_09930 [Oceanicola sp. 22II-s10i]
MTTRGDAADPKGLIRESYNIEGISEPECRSIFMDWALSLAEGADTPGCLDTLIARHADAVPDHPMSGLLRAGRTSMANTGRRGGRRGRLQ